MNKQIKKYYFPDWGILLLLLITVPVALVAQCQKPILRIGLIADPQYCDCPSNLQQNRFYKESLKKLSNAVDTLNEEKVDFVVSLGDIIDRDYKSYDSILPIYKQFEMPVYHILGNHEFNVEDSLKIKIQDRLEMPDNYYSFIRGNWEFVFLDGTELASYTLSIYSDLQEEYDSVRASIKGEPHDYSGNGGISNKQLNWLKRTLSNADSNNRNVLIFCHFPIYPLNIGLSLFNRIQVKAVIDEHRSVKGYISGHFHPGSFRKDAEIFFFIVTGMIRTQDENSFAILEICEDMIFIKGYGLIGDHKIPIENPNALPIEMPMEVPYGKQLGNMHTYPNPVFDDLLYINTHGIPVGNGQRYQIFDLAGRLLDSGELLLPERGVSIGHLATGHYLIKLQNSFGHFYARFSKR